MSELFPRLEPPPGGLARLHERLSRQELRRRRRRAMLVWASVPLAAALLLLLTIGLLRESATSESEVVLSELRSSLWARRHAIAAASEPLRIVHDSRGDAAALRIDSGRSDLLLYWVETLEGGGPEALMGDAASQEDAAQAKSL